jgi:hypothetical protein
MAAGLFLLAHEGADLKKTITYVRLYSDANGESHFEDLEIILTAEEVNPPEVPFFFSSFEKTVSFGYYCSPPGNFIDWHNAPRRQFLFCLAGEFEIEASDGEVRRFGKGSILLVEDTTGKGHISRVPGSVDSLSLVVTLE